MESLAKGAVRFSQRFTVQELQERWCALLYDPVVSAEASVHMIEFERSASTAKFNKDAKCISGKRKAGSVRKCYSAMRKRICCEPFDSIGISSQGGPGFINAEKSYEPLSADCVFEGEVSEYFGNQESNFGIMHHPIPEHQATGAGLSCDGISTGAFRTGFHDNDEDKSLGQSCVPRDVCQLFDNNIAVTGDQRIVKDFDESKELETYDLFESMDLDIDSSIIFEEIVDEEENACCGSESKVPNSSFSDPVTSLPNFSYSPIPQMPTWSAVEDFAPCTLSDVLGEMEDHAGNNLVIPDDFDANDPTIPGDSFVNSKSELGQMSSDGMKDSVQNAENFFEELSNSLLDFTPEDDLLFMDAEGNDMIEKSYIENFSLLLDSPHKSDTADCAVSDVAVAPHEYLSHSVTSTHPGEKGGQGQNRCDDLPVVWSSEAQKLSSALMVNPEFPEIRNGVICCTLNTEDPEIPNNDDVFLPIRLPSISNSSITHSKFDASYYPMLSSVKDFSRSQKPTNKTPMESAQSNYSQIRISSGMTGSSCQFETRSPHQIDELRVKFEPLNDDAQGVTTCEDPGLVNSAYSNKKNVVQPSGKELETGIEQPKNNNNNSSDSHIQKLAQASDLHMRFQKNAATSKQDVDGTSYIQNPEAINVERCSVGKTAEGAITVPTVSDEEELSCECDDNDDVPYFSDVEAMVKCPYLVAKLISDIVAGPTSSPC